MKPAELKTLREYLGLSANLMALKFGVEKRTIYYWEDGTYSTPEIVKTFLRQACKRLVYLVNMEVEKVLNFIKEVTEQNEPPEFYCLIRFQNDKQFWKYKKELSGTPNSFYNVVLAKTLEELERLNINATLIYMNENSYQSWLKEKEILDCEENLIKWAQMQKI